MLHKIQRGDPVGEFDLLIIKVANSACVQRVIGVESNAEFSAALREGRDPSATGNPAEGTGSKNYEIN